MIPTDLIERRKMISRMLHHCGNTVTDGDGFLSQWEEDFIESTQIQFTDKGNLTDKQCEILEKIYDKL